MTNEQKKQAVKFAFAIVRAEELGNLHFLEEKPNDVIITDDGKIDLSLREFRNSVAFYVFRNADELLKVCLYHEYVWIDGIRKEGKNVTMEDAVKVFDAHAKTKEELEQLSLTQESRHYNEYLQNEYPDFI